MPKNFIMKMCALLQVQCSYSVFINLTSFYGTLRQQNCYILNFGWPTETSIPQIDLSTDLNLELKGSASLKDTAPSGCLSVIIGDY